MSYPLNFVERNIFLNFNFSFVRQVKKSSRRYFNFLYILRYTDKKSKKSKVEDVSILNWKLEK